MSPDKPLGVTPDYPLGMTTDERQRLIDRLELSERASKAVAAEMRKKAEFWDEANDTVAAELREFARILEGKE